MATSFVAGQAVPAAAFVIEGVVLSSYRPSGTRLLPFSFEVPVNEFLAILGEAYEALVVDLMADDALTGDSSPLREAGYPSLLGAIGSPALLLHLLQAYLMIDLLSWYLQPPGALSNARYFITELSDARLTDDKVVFQGRCLEYDDARPAA